MSFFSVVTTAWLLSGGAIDPATGRSLNEITQGVSGDYATLEWHDAEDHLDGFISPSSPVEGRPFEVNVRIRGLDSTGYQGPVVLTLRKVGEQLGTSVTVTPKGDRWKHTFQVDDAGQYQLDVGFRTTRMKHAQAIIPVREDMTIAGVPLSIVGLTVAGLIAVGTIGSAVIRMLRARNAPPG